MEHKLLEKVAFDLLKKDTNGNYEIISRKTGLNYVLKIYNRIVNFSLLDYFENAFNDINRKELLDRNNCFIVAENKNIIVTKYKVYLKHTSQTFSLYYCNYYKLKNNRIDIYFDSPKWNIKEIESIKKVTIIYPDKFYLNDKPISAEELNEIGSAKYFNFKKRVFLDQDFRVKCEHEIFLFYENKLIKKSLEWSYCISGHVLYTDTSTNEIYICLKDTNYVILKASNFKIKKFSYLAHLIYERSTKKYFLYNKEIIYDLKNSTIENFYRFFTSDELKDLELNKNPTKLIKQIKLEEAIKNVRP